MAENEEYRCLDIWRVPRGAGITALPDQRPETREALQRTITSTYTLSSKGPFPADSLTQQAPISAIEHLAVVVTLTVVMGGALWWPFFGVGLALFASSWSYVVAYLVATAVLALHPMPDVAAQLSHSWILQCIYKYFTYRLIYSEKQRVLMESQTPWIGTGVPHGVMPFSNLLSTPAVQSFVFFPPRQNSDSGAAAEPGLADYPFFVGAPASVVFHTPFLRYFTLFRSATVDRASITRQLEAGNNVGLVGDGIAGIFKQTKEDEVIALKERKGLAKLALRTGTPLIPCYSFGNTEIFSLYYDSYGWMEWISRKAQASIFVYWGRFGLPIPHRANVTMAVGEFIPVEKIPNPTPEQIDMVHQQLLMGVRKVFDTHKRALGWGHKVMRFV